LHPVRLIEYLLQRRIRLRRRTPIKEYRILKVFLIYFAVLRFAIRYSLFIFIRALSSAGSERTPHTRKVVGSIPTAPTIGLHPAGWRLWRRSQQRPRHNYQLSIDNSQLTIIWTYLRHHECWRSQMPHPRRAHALEQQPGALTNASSPASKILSTERSDSYLQKK
jgi:hypothetical protein